MIFGSTNFNSSTFHSLRYAKSTQTKSAHVRHQLKTGKRIVNISDDPSGAMITGLMKSKASSIFEGLKNLNEAVAILDLATSALDSLSGLFVNLKMLAIRANSGLKVTSQILQIELGRENIRKCFNEVLKDTEFNGKRLLTGGINNCMVNYGAGTLTFSIPSVRKEAIAPFIANNITGADNIPAGFILEWTDVFYNFIDGIADGHDMLLIISQINLSIKNLNNIRGNLAATQTQLDTIINSLENNLVKTEEGIAIIEDVDALEAQVDAVTMKSQESRSLQAFMLSLQEDSDMYRSTIKTMQYIMT